jgi:hypothetical protein
MLHGKQRRYCSKHCLNKYHNIVHKGSSALKCSKCGGDRLVHQEYCDSCGYHKPDMEGPYKTKLFESHLIHDISMIMRYEHLSFSEAIKEMHLSATRSRKESRI